MGSDLKVHHLDCATMCPVATGGHEVVAHVLAIETPSAGIVLVDTGIGDSARRNPRQWLGKPFVSTLRPDCSIRGSALSQLKALGLAPEDVQHILVTHLDLDHAGALADFPNATVHVHSHELAAALQPSLREKSRYRSIQWGHGPKWRTYETTGEAWFGFDAVHNLEGLSEDILAIPLPGHTRGHTAIAVNGPDGWLLHCGDAYFDASTVNSAFGPAPAMIRRFEQVVAVDRRKVAANHGRLKELIRNHGDQVTAFSAHDKRELDHFRSLGS